MDFTQLNFTRDKAVCLDLLFSTYEAVGNYFSKINIVKKIDKKMRPVGYLATNVHEKFDINRFWNEKRDIYITKNGMINSGCWKRSNLSTLHNIIVDIDCHDKKCPYDDIYNAAYALHTLMLEKCIFPNVINITGRGIQLWWFIEPLPKSLLKYYNEVVNMFINAIDIIITQDLPEVMQTQKLGMTVDEYKKYEALTNFSVDKKPSKNASGLMRFPGSYNTAVNEYGMFSFQHKSRVNVMEEFFEEHPAVQYADEEERKYYRKLAKKAKKSNKKKATDQFKKFQQRKIPKNHNADIAEFRKNVLYGLVKMRVNNGQTIYKKRDLILHFLAAAYVSSGRTKEETIAAVLDLNKKFDLPLPEHEAVTYMSTTLRKGYWYTNAMIIEVLNITEREQVALGFYASNKKAKTEATVKHCQKEERDEKILELHAVGLKQKEIAQQLNTSQSTVCRVLNENGIIKKKRKRKYFVKDMIQRLRVMANANTGEKVCSKLNVKTKAVCKTVSKAALKRHNTKVKEIQTDREWEMYKSQNEKIFIFELTY